MARIPLIGVAGAARSGKDTTANFIIAAVGGYRYSFADPIRGMLTHIGVHLNDPYWADRKEQVIPILGVSPRRLMQTLGTEWGRELINPDLWLILAQQNLAVNGPGMVITDVRFDNEAEWIRRMGGKVIHISRNSAPAVEAHKSEAGIAHHNTDSYIFNTGTLEDLQNNVRGVLNVLYQT